MFVIRTLRFNDFYPKKKLNHTIFPHSQAVQTFVLNYYLIYSFALIYLFIEIHVRQREITRQWNNAAARHNHTNK